MCEKEMTIERSKSVQVFEKFDLGDGTMEVSFSFEGQVYRQILPRMTNEAFVDWLSDYANKTPKCAACKRIIFPDDTIIVNPDGFNNDSITHISCGNESNGFIGHFDEHARCHLNAPSLQG